MSQETSSSPTPFPYAERAAAARAAHEALHVAFKAVTRRNDRDDPATAKWLTSISRFNQTVSEAYPSNFRRDIALLRAWHPEGIKAGIEFICTDPWFFGSGYMKEHIIQFLKRCPMTTDDMDQLQNALLAVIDKHDRREFRHFCRLAKRVDGPKLRDGLELRRSSPNKGIQRRARWIEEAIGAAPRLARHEQASVTN